MQFPLPLVHGTLIKRYKRFLADVALAGGSVVTAHCPNSGSMKACAEPGRPVFLSDHGPDTARKLRYTWEAIRMGRTWVGVNTMNPNRVVHEALVADGIPELAGYAQARREVVYGSHGRSRIDVLLTGHASRPDCYVEVKNTTMREGEACLFPDAVTERGRKHLEDLAREVKRGASRGDLLFVGRGDVEWMGPADGIDPAYGKALRKAVAQGVEALAYRARVTPAGIVLERRVDMRL